MMRRIFLLAVLVLWATPVLGQVQDTSRLPTGVRLGMLYQTLRRPDLAVRPFAGDGGYDAIAGEVYEILRRDLDYSDRFEMAVAPPQLSVGPVEYQPWNQLGIVYLVTGSVERADDGLLLRVQLHDVVYNRVRQNQAFTLPAANSPDFRMAVHAAADEVVRWATGVKGMAASRIVFTRTTASGSELMVVDSDGENPRRIAAGSETIMSPAWAPDGRRIAYALGASDGSWQLVERNLGNNAVRNIEARHSLIMTPAYSPDGRRLAFSVWTGQRTDLFEYDLERGCCRQAIRSGPGEDISPSYSPDGRQVAFMSDRIGQPHIYVMSASGGEASLLTHYNFGESGYYTSPSWSPESSLIAFHGRSRGGLEQIMVADATRPGAEIRQITESGRNTDPSWAPDGRHIVYVTERGNRYILNVMDTVSGRIRPLVADLGRVRMPDWSWTLMAPPIASTQDR